MIEARDFSDKLLNLKNVQTPLPSTLHLKSMKLNSQMLPSSRSGSTGKEPYSMVGMPHILADLQSENQRALELGHRAHLSRGQSLNSDRIKPAFSSSELGRGSLEEGEILRAWRSGS